MKYAFFFIAGLIVLSSCEKDDSFVPLEETDPVLDDTSASLALFPTHPGSYWIYDNGDTAKVDDDYMPTQHYDTYTASWWSAPTQLPDSTEVNSPYYSNPSFKSGLFRDYTFYPDTYHDTPYRIFSASSDNWTSKDLQHVDDVHLVTVRDSMMTILGESMEVTIVRTAEESDLMTPDYTGDPDFWGTYRYYAKDVGLVKTIYKVYPDSTEYTIDILEYFIND